MYAATRTCLEARKNGSEVLLGVLLTNHARRVADNTHMPIVGALLGGIRRWRRVVRVAA